MFEHTLALPLPQCGNMAREGLRTLVVGKKVLSEEQYTVFEVSVCVCVFADYRRFVPP